MLTYSKIEDIICRKHCIVFKKEYASKSVRKIKCGNGKQIQLSKSKVETEK